MRKTLALTLFVFSSFCLAHTGSHTSNLVIELDEAEFTHNKANISLTLRNRGHKSLILNSIKTNVGKTLTLIDFPLVIKAQSKVSFSHNQGIQVFNKQGLVQIFTLVLDFGEAGSGPVTIVPTSFKE